MSAPITKRQALGIGAYRFKAPPVCTAFWDSQAWIKWIDACNGWTVPVREEKDGNEGN